MNRPSAHLRRNSFKAFRSLCHQHAIQLLSCLRPFPNSPARTGLALGRGLSCGLEPVLIGLKDSRADIALHLDEADLFVREVGKEPVEPAVYFLKVSHRRI